MTEDASNRDLVLSRLIPAPPAAVYRAFVEPALLERWFAPKPYTTAVTELDVRPGGRQRLTMTGPDGTSVPVSAVYLEVVANARIVGTDAYTEAWVPSAKPFMTVIFTFDPEDGGTRYTARARHWRAEDREAHEAMGFHRGWGICADQLAKLVASL